MIQRSEPQSGKALASPTTALGFVWIVFALLFAGLATWFLHGQIPFFTFIWLTVPLAALLRWRDAKRIGIRPVEGKVLLRVTAITAIVLTLITSLFEPWSHTGRHLYRLALAAAPPDATFLWMRHFPGVAGWAAMVAYSGLVTIFAEELFFRGWLLQWLLRRLRPLWAVILQATVFTLCINLLVAFFMPRLQGVIYVVVYSWLGVGVVCWWAAARTQGIWPGLIVNVLGNAIGVLGFRP